MLAIEQVGGGAQAPFPRRPTSVEALALASLLCIIPGDGEKRNQSLAHHPQCFTYAPVCHVHRDCRAGSTDNRVSLMPTKQALEDRPPQTAVLSHWKSVITGGTKAGLSQGRGALCHLLRISDKLLASVPAGRAACREWARLLHTPYPGDPRPPLCFWFHQSRAPSVCSALMQVISLWQPRDLGASSRSRGQ